MPLSGELHFVASVVECALALAVERAGNNRPTRIAITAMTTNSSISVNPRFDRRLVLMADLCRRWLSF